jgi:competence protein ComEC
MSHPLLQLAVAFLAGCRLGDGLRVQSGICLLLTAAVLLLLAPHAARGSRRAALLAAAFALGSAGRVVEGVSHDRATLPSVVERLEPTDVVTVVGTLAAEPRDNGDRWRLVLDLVSLAEGGGERPVTGRLRVDVAGTAARPALEPGDVVRLPATVRLPRGSATPGVESAELRARREGVHAWGSCKSPRLVERLEAGRAGWSRLAARARAAARRALVRHTPPGQEQGLVRALVLGDRTGLDAETAESFRRSGTYHVLAISGAQVALLVAVLLAIGRGAGLGGFHGAVVVSVLATFYGAVVGAEAPVLRAVVMAVVLLAGRWLDLGANLPNLLGAAAIALAAVRPSQVEEPSFQLSFAATLGLLLGSSAIASRLPRLPLRLEMGLAASLAAQAALLPLMLLHFHRLAPAGLLLNIVAVPLSGLVMMLGLASVLCSPVEAAAAVLAQAAWATAHVLLRSCDPWGLAAATDGRLPDPPYWACGIFLAGLVGAWRGRPRSGLLVAAGALFSIAARSPAADGRLHVTLVDVGQGEAIVLRSPRGHTIVVDAGPGGERFDAGEHVVAPYLFHLGIRRLDALVVSHAHPDHTGGAAALLRALPTDEAWEGLAPMRDPTYDRWATDVRQSGATRLTVLRGHERVWDGVRLEVLSPAPARRAPWRVRNDDSVVVRATFGGVSFLLTGDLEAGGEALLGPRPANVLKVGHHGSRTSSSAALLAATRPRLAVASLGSGNHFGHPHPEVVRRLSEGGAHVLRTDRDGTIDVATDGTSVAVCTGRGGCSAAW